MSNDTLKAANARTPPPASLFKYFGPDGARLFDTWHIRCSQPGALNDPFEFKPHIAAWGTPDEEYEKGAERWEEDAKTAYDDLCNEHGKRMEFAEFRARILPKKEWEVRAALAQIAAAAYLQMGDGMASMINKGMGILCLSESADNLLMWAHYASSHTGFVVEFDTTADFFNTKVPPAWVKCSDEDAVSYAAEYGFLREVSYVANRPSVVLTTFSFDTFAVKGEPWRYEKEWRMLMPLDYASQWATPHTLPYPICLWSVPPSALKRVIVGSRASDGLIGRVRQLRAGKESEHIALDRCRVDHEHFLVIFEPLDA